MTAGALSHRIYIQRRGKDTTDGNGNAVQNWEPINTNPIWAAKRGLAGREFYAAAASNAEDNILFTVRCNATTKTVTPRMRIVEGSKVYNITAPIVDIEDAHQWLEIHAEEVT